MISQTASYNGGETQRESRVEDRDKETAGGQQLYRQPVTQKLLPAENSSMRPLEVHRYRESNILVRGGVLSSTRPCTPHALPTAAIAPRESHGEGDKDAHTGSERRLLDYTAKLR